MHNLESENLTLISGGKGDDDIHTSGFGEFIGGTIGASGGALLGAVTGGATGIALGGGAYAFSEAGKHLGDLLERDMIRNPEKWTHPEYENPWNSMVLDKLDKNEHQGGKSRVICTHFYQKGMLSRELWRADMEFTLRFLPQSMVNGYHLWAIPYVKLMRKSSLAEKVMYPIAYYRAKEIAYKMGYIKKGSIRGKIFRAILEPICSFLGMFTKEHKYQELWRNA